MNKLTAREYYKVLSEFLIFLHERYLNILNLLKKERLTSGSKCSRASLARVPTAKPMKTHIMLTLVL